MEERELQRLPKLREETRLLEERAALSQRWPKEKEEKPNLNPYPQIRNNNPYAQIRSVSPYRELAQRVAKQAEEEFEALAAERKRQHEVRSALCLFFHSHIQ